MAKVKDDAWHKVYYQILGAVKKKYPKMSKEAQVIRAYKCTNSRFNRYRVNENR